LATSIVALAEATDEGFGPIFTGAACAAAGTAKTARAVSRARR
jgi:hypothetical protein